MKFFISILFVFTCFACNTIYQPQKATYYDYRVSPQKKQDEAVLTILKPYSDSINKTMNLIIAEAAETLEKKQPNGSLGLVLVDAVKEMAAFKYNTNVDAAFMNNGGIRIPTVPKGNITVGKVYEIMPFDNLIVLQKVNGKIFKEFLNLIAKRGGWPVSGVTFTITNGAANNILVDGLALDENKIYTLANSDYIANGGDDCEMLKVLPQLNQNVLMRDVFIEFFKMQTQKGIKIAAPSLSNRIKLL
jgi:2',3'-cyclic-nucleotide 2'-phosphodiesterase (5'-nucleotidase family)